jgi:hypothetical protein
VSVEFEIATTGHMTHTDQQAGGSTLFHSRRDQFLGGQIRFHLFGGRIADIEPLVGFLIVQRTAWVVQTSRQSGISRTDLGTPTAFGASVGLDARGVIATHLALIASARGRFTNTGVKGFERNYPGGGLPYSTVAGSVGIRYEF